MFKEWLLLEEIFIEAYEEEYSKITQLYDNWKRTQQGFDMLIEAVREFAVLYARGKRYKTNQKVVPEDFAQEISIKVIKTLRKQSGASLPDDIQKWLFVVMENYFWQLGRKKKKEEQMPDQIQVPYLTNADEEDEKKFIRSIVDELPEPHKTVAIMHYYQDLKGDEIARHYGCSPGNIKRIFYEIREKIKKRLKKVA